MRALALVVALAATTCRTSADRLGARVTEAHPAGDRSAAASFEADRRAMDERQQVCAAWKLKRLDEHELRAVSDELAHRWLGGGAHPDGGTAIARATASDERLTRVGTAVTQQLQGRAFSFLVVDDGRLDSFSVPDGRVFVTRGLLSAAKTDGQLAGVTAHEAAHVHREHALTLVRQRAEQSCRLAVMAQAMARAMVQTTAGQPEFAALLPELTKTSDQLTQRLADDLATQLLVQGYGEKRQAGAPEELEADRFAAEWMHGAGYDVREYEAVLQGLVALSVPHPSTEQRLAALEERRATLPPLPAPKKKKK